MDAFMKSFKISFQIDNVSERDEGFYFCAVMSLAGSIINRVHLKVKLFPWI